MTKTIHSIICSAGVGLLAVAVAGCGGKSSVSSLGGTGGTGTGGAAGGASGVGTGGSPSLGGSPGVRDAGRAGMDSGEFPLGTGGIGGAGTAPGGRGGATQPADANTTQPPLLDGSPAGSTGGFVGTGGGSGGVGGVGAGGASRVGGTTGMGGVPGTGGLPGTGGSTSPVDGGGAAVVYTCCVWSGGLDHMTIEQQDLDADTCLTLALSAPSVNRTGYDVALPANWGLITARSGPCSYLGSSTGPTSITGTISWVPGSIGAGLPDVVDVDVVLYFGEDAGTGASVVFSAKGVPASYGC